MDVEVTFTWTGNATRGWQVFIEAVEANMVNGLSGFSGYSGTNAISTQNVATGSRTLGTSYQNTGSSTMFVAVAVTSNATLYAYTDADNIFSVANFSVINDEEVSQSNVSSDLKRALGLMHENIYIDLPVYDSDNNLVSARVRIYSQASSVGTTSDIIGTYLITANSAGAGKFTTWSQTK
jgi:hypothetical protein